MTLAGAVDTSFWATLIPRLSLVEPTVRHAAVALSALHEHFDFAGNETVKKDRRRLGLQEYSQAISLMRSYRPPAGNDSMLLPLVVCLLFICIEFLLDDEATSQVHIRQGRKLLSEMANSLDQSSPTFDMVKHALVPIYTRLSLASYTMGSNPEPVPAEFKLSRSTITLPLSFEDLRRSIFETADAGFHLGFAARPIINAIEPDRLRLQTLSTTQAHLLSELAQWRANFAASSPFPHQQQQQTPVQDSDQCFLLLLYHVMHVWISTALSPDETAYDAYITSFRAVTALASSILKARANSAADTDAHAHTNSFVFETELIPALYWVAMKCRHATIRREALVLLAHDVLKCRRENLWDALESHVVGARIVALEECHAIRSKTTTGAVTVNMADNGDGLTAPLHLLERASIEETLTVITKQAGVTSPASTPVSGSGSESVACFERNTGVLSQMTLDEDEKAPFGIPERCRVKFGVVGPRDRNGTWLTVYMEAEGQSKEWKTGKEYVRWVKR